MRPLQTAPISRRAVVFSGLSLFIALTGSTGCSDKDGRSTQGGPAVKKSSGGKTPIDIEALAPKVAKFCGACHAVPKPASFPKRAWYEEVRKGYGFYEESNRADLAPPKSNDVVSYYRALAPDKLVVPEPANSPAKLRFSRTRVTSRNSSGFPSVSHLSWVVDGKQKRGELLLCDMKHGAVRSVQFDGRTVRPHAIADLSNPAHVERCDFGKTGQRQFLVSELGSFPPGDHNKGQVVWLRDKVGDRGFETLVIKSELGRVADARPGDFDGDGDMDVIVAEFGWRKTGRILLLKQTGRKDGVPQFETTVIDNRHGTIHVPVLDINGDGRLDFIALISQEFETVVAFVNRGDGTFERKPIYEAGDPSFGSSGIQIVDLDGDGDQDVLFTNGDSLDSFYLKPYHAIHWLENKGTFPFTHHELTQMPGVSRAVAGDLDGDGDIDIVACAYLPARVLNDSVGRDFDSLIWLEQQPDHTFARHILERTAHGHLALALGDFDGDGALDICVGNHMPGKSGSKLPWFTVWWNDGPIKKTARRAKGK